MDELDKNSITKTIKTILKIRNWKINTDCQRHMMYGLQSKYKSLQGMPTTWLSFMTLQNKVPTSHTTEPQKWGMWLPAQCSLQYEEQTVHDSQN